MDRAIEAAIHRSAYLGLQFLRGRPVGPYLQQLQRWERLDRAEFVRLTDELLRQTLDYAYATVPLYSSGRWLRALRATDGKQLAAWPILDRRTVKLCGRDLLSTRRSPATFYRHSSASTGEPLRVAWNPNGAGWGWATEYRSLLWYGVGPGDRTLLMWGTGHPLQDWVKNCRVFRTKELTSRHLEEAARYLLDRKPRLCMGLPSALTQLARHVRENHPRAPASLVPVAKLGGEQVYPFQRDELTRHLGARIMETYGCTEVGPIAQQCPAGSMHLMEENVCVEIFKNDEPAAPGEFGDIVVTSLTNRAMPLVRCKIGDSGSISDEGCSCGRPHRILTKLVGRAADVFLAADGTPVHGSTLGWNLRSFLGTQPLGAIRQLLFQQIDQSHWKVLIESETGFDVKIATQLEQFVRDTFGQQCAIDVERVPVVPREPSGKFRYYRPAYLRTDPSH